MRATDRRRSPSARPRQGQRCDLLWRQLRSHKLAVRPGRGS
jgi:hypothetical protein